ncbi:MAG: arginyl-tRNA synthetase [Candidatus Methanomethylophilaceae archaeon]|nr:arginyl-tRNA synthetase [Candidatus Methanomethylophilaceae archaeon]
MSITDDFRNEVNSAVKKALAESGSEVEFIIEVPSVGDADLAVPCFTMAKSMKRSPKDIAEKLAGHIEPSGTIKAVSALNGYVNFNIDQNVLVTETLNEIISKGDGYGSHPPTGVRVNVEHTSTNPTGPIHVGRARNPIIGDTLARCLRMCGNEVTTEYYVNDVGKQVVILTWGVENIPKGSVEEEEREKTDHKLVAYYRKANKLMEEDPAVAEQISEMLRKFEAGDQEVIGSVRHTAKIMLEGLNQSLAGINVVLDRYTWESDFIADGSAASVVSRLKRTDYAGQTEDGSWYIDLAEFGINGKNTKFTFTRSDGTTLYTTRDIAYHMSKFSRSDRVIDVLGEDQKLGSQQLTYALRILGCVMEPEPMFYAFVSLPEGKMSTRKGVVVYLDDLIDEAVDRAYEEIKSRRDDMDEEKMREIARVIGVGAIRYNVVRVQPEKQFVFTWKEALNFDGNSGPYLQYVHARACSMLRKAGDFERDIDASKLTDEYEIKLVKVLSKFSSIVEEAGNQKRIHVLPAYGHEVASAFNQFYAAVPVLSSGECANARLTLVECSRIVLRNVLDCLGMGAPEEM